VHRTDKGLAVHQKLILRSSIELVYPRSGKLVFEVKLLKRRRAAILSKVRYDSKQQFFDQPLAYVKGELACRRRVGWISGLLVIIVGHHAIPHLFSNRYLAPKSPTWLAVREDCRGDREDDARGKRAVNRAGYVETPR